MIVVNGGLGGHCPVEMCSVQWNVHGGIPAVSQRPVSHRTDNFIDVIRTAIPCGEVFNGQVSRACLTMRGAAGVIRASRVVVKDDSLSEGGKDKRRAQAAVTSPAIEKEMVQKVARIRILNWYV